MPVIYAKSRPLAIDLYAGLGGWTEGLLAEGFDVVGFDIEQHVYGEHRYPAQLVLQDVRTIHGAQFKDAALIVASSPCQEYSYMAMPWSRAKEKARWYREDPTRQEALNELFNQPARIQREAIAAAGRFIPMVQENVKGAQPWVGRARWHFGSYYLWGDVPALMPFTQLPGTKVPGMDWSKFGEPGYKAVAFNDPRHSGAKNTGGSWFNIGSPGQTNVGKNPDGRCAAAIPEGTKVGGGWFHDAREHTLRRHSSKSKARKAASARIAKIPLPLAQWIAHCYYPHAERVA